MSDVTNTVERDSLKSAISISKWIACIYAVLQVIVILLGFYYHKGWLKAYGINDDLFPISIQDALILSHQTVISFFSESYKEMMGNFGNLLVEAVALGVFMASVMYIIALRQSRPEVKDQRHENSRRSDKDKASAWKDFFNGRGLWGSLFWGLMTTAVVYIYPRVLLVCAFFISVVPVMGYFAATKDAKKMQSDSQCLVAENNQNKAYCDVLIVQEKGENSSKSSMRKYYGDIVAANDKWVAISLRDRTLVLPIDGVQMEFAKKK